MIGRGQEARMQEAISWSWKQFCPSPRAARRPHPFLIRVIIIKCNLPPAHFQNPPSFPTSPSDWRKANQKKREFLFKVQKTAKCKGQQTKGKAGEIVTIWSVLTLLTSQESRALLFFLEKEIQNRCWPWNNYTNMIQNKLERLLMCMCKVPLVHHVRSGLLSNVLDWSWYMYTHYTAVSAAW